MQNTIPVHVSVVVIGRNEGARLSACLQSVHGADWAGLSYEVIYVDSRSSDNSLQVAAAADAQALLLGDAFPCAAKARNLGWQAARGEFILFLDGDTVLAPDFVRLALAEIRQGNHCAVWGHRRESNPAQSIYTKVLDLDWIYPAGLTPYFGGDVLVRRHALAQVGGFDGSLKAGEEPELCARLRAAGWTISHIDKAMTLHDLAIHSWRAYWLRAYRSGIAYAEVAQRARHMGDALWQREARRDLFAGALYVSAPLLLALAYWQSPALALTLVALALLGLARTAWRCRWKAPGQPLLCLQYAVHSHVQKLPALAGQLAWRRAHQQHRDLQGVDYKSATGLAPVTAQRPSHNVKEVLATVMAPLAWLRRVVGQPLNRVWQFARLREALPKGLPSDCVVLGAVELHGTRNICIGNGALIYPGVYLETQGAGRISIGDGVVLSRGVHIVAHEAITLGDHCMVGEYSSIRDANHRTSSDCIRHSGHEATAIHIGRNSWIGRGVTVLRGVRIGANSVVGANAVVTHNLVEHSRVAGVPARSIA